MNNMSRCLLTYSSVTGNTRQVADAIHQILPKNTAFYPVSEAPSPENFDLVMIGFWTYRAGPDPAAARYMETVRNRNVAFFGTLAAYPDSDHARRVIAKAETLLSGNRILGFFLCQGKLAPERLAKRLGGEQADGRHPMTEERRLRLLEAAKHPDARDLAMARERFQMIWEHYRREENS